MIKSMKDYQVYLTVISSAILILSVIVLLVWYMNWWKKIKECFSQCRGKISDESEKSDNKIKKNEEESYKDVEPKTIYHSVEESNKVFAEIDRKRAEIEKDWNEFVEKDNQERLEREKQRNIRDANRESDRDQRDLQDKQNFIARYPGKYQLDQNNEIVFIPIADDEGIVDDGNIDVDSIDSSDNLNQQMHNKNN